MVDWGSSRNYLDGGVFIMNDKYSPGIAHFWLVKFALRR